MVSCQGTFEFYDDAFAYPESVFRPVPAIKESYPENSVMWYINKFHPKFAFLIKRARLDRQMGDPEFNGTVFLPLEDSILEDDIVNMDTNTARKIVKYHFMMGFFPKNVLFTSPYQQLQSTMKGSFIWAQMPTPDSMLLNFSTPIVYYDIKMVNGIIHIIHNLLFENGPRC
jgi:uncharacterized surface protein with fasciclin (FAS1) repeats